MRIETELVERKKYIAKDGKVFYDYDACEAYEEDIRKRENGDRKTCPKCHGSGRIDGHYEKIFDGGMYGDHEYHDTYIDKECPECGGKGYLERKTVWA